MRKMQLQDQIEKEKNHQGYGCPGLENAKYIYRLEFNLNISMLYNNTLSVDGNFVTIIAIIKVLN